MNKMINFVNGNIISVQKGAIFRDNELVEVHYDEANETIVIKKYQTSDSLEIAIQGYLNTIFTGIGFHLIVSDTSNIIASTYKEEVYCGAAIGNVFKKFMEERKVIVDIKPEHVEIKELFYETKWRCVSAPIFIQHRAVGAVVLLETKDQNRSNLFNASEKINSLCDQITKLFAKDIVF